MLPWPPALLLALGDTLDASWNDIGRIDGLRTLPGICPAAEPFGITFASVGIDSSARSRMDEFCKLRPQSWFWTDAQAACRSRTVVPNCYACASDVTFKLAAVSCAAVPFGITFASVFQTPFWNVLFVISVPKGLPNGGHSEL